MSRARVSPTAIPVSHQLPILMANLYRRKFRREIVYGKEIPLKYPSCRNLLALNIKLEILPPSN